MEHFLDWGFGLLEVVSTEWKCVCMCMFVNVVFFQLKGAGEYVKFTWFKLSDPMFIFIMLLRHFLPFFCSSDQIHSIDFTDCHMKTSVQALNHVGLCLLVFLCKVFCFRNVHLNPYSFIFKTQRVSMAVRYWPFITNFFTLVLQIKVQVLYLQLLHWNIVEL